MNYKPRAEIRDGKKQCRKCLEWIDVSLFGTFLDSKTPKRYINSRCKSCASGASKEWALKYPEKDKLRREILNKKTQENRDIIYSAYGNKCNCCGETNKLFLTIDHVNNDGYKIRPKNNKGRRQSEFSGHYYIQIIKANFPSDLQLLCWNCNCGKHRNGGICPHKTI